MKKTSILLLFAVGALAFSCGKSYTCDCTVTEHYSDADTTYTNTAHNSSSSYSKKMSKKQATSACDHEAVALKSTYDSFGGGGTPDPNDHIAYSCVVK